MRRKDREVKDFEKIKEIITESDTIRLGFNDGDFPYIVPLSFGYEFDEEQIYFYVHGALEGKKVDLMKSLGKCSFEMDCGHQLELLPQYRDVTMRYKSLMGKAEVKLLEDEEKVHAINALMVRDDRTKDFDFNRNAIAHTMVARLKVIEYSGKINAPSVKED